MQRIRRTSKTHQPHRKSVQNVVDGVRKWVTTCPIAYTDLSKISGLTRHTIYKCVDGGDRWNPTLKTVLALAGARDLLEARMRELSKREK